MAAVALQPAIMDGGGEAQPLLQTAPRTGVIPAARAAIERLGSQITHGLQDFVTRGITPIAEMRNFQIAELQIDPVNDLYIVWVGKVFCNPITYFHQKVIQKGEEVSHAAGIKTYEFLKAQSDGVAPLLWNTVALAISFAVKGIILGFSQLGHIIPYIVLIALIGMFISHSYLAVVMGVIAILSSYFLIPTENRPIPLQPVQQIPPNPMDLRLTVNAATP